MLAAKNRYNTYSLETKLQVVKSQDPYFFSNEGVPRTTAIYWIQNSEKFDDIEIQSNHFYESKIKILERKIEAEKTLKNLLIIVRKLHPYSFEKKKVKSKSTKRKIIDALNLASELIPLNTCLSTISLSPSSYYRWLTVFKKCEISGKECQKRRKHQLTLQEITAMKSFVVSKKYSHLPVSSLCLLAQREEKLFCSQDTWYKYINLNDWKRPKSKKYKKQHNDGLRASVPNQFWHIDVSKIIFMGPKKFYFQAIIDNYSRMILAWQLEEKISAENTIKLIKKAKNKYREIIGKETHDLITDGGSENTAGSVTEYLSSTNLKRLIAQKDIIYSNSMIEAFFKALKNNYFYYQKIRSVEDIKRKLKFYVTQHNETIPKQQLKGATPIEAFTQTWTEENINDLKEKRLLAQKLRKSENTKPTCQICK